MGAIAKIISYLSKYVPTVMNESQATNMLKFDDVAEQVAKDEENKNKKGLFHSFKKNTAVLFENYKAARRLILLFLIGVNGYLVYITANQYVKTNVVDANWVSIVEIYSGILIVVTCYYLHLRSKDITTAKGTTISNTVESVKNENNTNNTNNTSES